MTNNFQLGQPVYLIERNLDGDPICPNNYTFVTFADRIVIVKGDATVTQYDAESLITRLLENTAAGEDSYLFAFPAEDCYPTWNRADHAIGVERLRKEQEDEF